MKRILSLIFGLLAAQCEASMIPLLSGSAPTGMVTPVFVYGGPPASVNTGATEYSQFSGQTPNWGSVTTANTPMPIDGSVRGLRVVLETAPGVGTSWTYTLYKNSVATSLTVTIADGATSATDSTNVVSFAAGDSLAWAAIPANTPTAPTNLLISCMVSASFKQSLFTGGDTGSVSNSESNYRSMWTSGAWSNSEVSNSMLMPTAGTLDRLYIKLNGTPDGAATYAFTVYKNGAPTALTCTVASAATTASDLSNSITFSAGDTISLQCTPSGTPTARAVTFSARMQPDANGESIHGSSVTSSSISAVRYYRIDSARTSAATTATTATASIMPGSGTIQKLYFSLATAPSAGKNRVMQSYVNAGAGNLTATIADAATSANDTTHTDSVSAGDSVWFLTTPTGTPTDTTWIKSSVVIVAQ